MRDAADLRLDEAIVHVLNPRRDQGVMFSRAVIPLARNPRIAEYLVSHIQHSLRDPTTRTARFTEAGAGSPFGVCGDVLTGTIGLVEGSRRLAERLCDLIAADRRIAPGDLVVCRFSAGNHPSVPGYLGMLKLDPAEVFRHRQDHDDDGNAYITLELDSDALPTTGERLQKCAFVRPLDPRPEGYDMMLLDRQVGEGGAQQVARFFVDRFLGAELAYSPSQQTNAFYRCVIRTINRARDDEVLALVDEEAVRVATDLALQAPAIDTEVWIASLPGSDELHRRLGEALAAELPDQRIEIDRRVADGLVKKRRFRGSFGLKVEVEAERFGEVVQAVDRIGGDGADGRWRIVIETEQWEEVTR